MGTSYLRYTTGTTTEEVGREEPKASSGGAKERLEETKQMNYCNISTNKQHVLNILHWLIDGVLSSGGDGDGIWYSKFYSVADIKKLIEDEKLLPGFWKMEFKEDGSLHLGDNQEWLTITNNEWDWTKRPSWQEVGVVW